MVVIVIIPILQRGKLRLREGKELGYLTGWNLGLETNSPVPQSGSACGPTRFSAGQSVRRAHSLQVEPEVGQACSAGQGSIYRRGLPGRQGSLTLTECRLSASEDN